MTVEMLKGKIHRATVKQAELDYVGSITVDEALLEASGIRDYDGEALQKSRQNLMVTPRDIDQQVRDLSKVVGYGINWALQDLEIEEINALLS